MTQYIQCTAHGYVFKNPSPAQDLNLQPSCLYYSDLKISDQSIFPYYSLSLGLNSSHEDQCFGDRQAELEHEHLIE